MEPSKRLLSILIVMLMSFINSSEANNIIVGGKDGWVVNPSENYNSWASRNRFQVNDTLIFKYKKGKDSVLIVSKEDYDNCNTKKPIKSMKDGESKIKFDRSGPFFFISGKKGNCEKGEKLHLVVITLRKPNNPSPSISPPAPVSTTPLSAPQPSTSPSLSPPQPVGGHEDSPSISTTTPPPTSFDIYAPVPSTPAFTTSSSSSSSANFIALAVSALIFLSLFSG